VNYYTSKESCETADVTRPSGAALLLSQLGVHVAAEFRRRLAPVGLTPAHVGILRVLAFRPGISQQELAEAVGAVPSRVVKLLDELAERDLIERRRSQADRRSHELHLSSAARGRLAEVRGIVSEHDAAVTAGLTAAELETLVALLTKVAQAQGIEPTGHPGYRASS
jgi:DNA-binding MarR family transcriptional regulator